MLSMSWSRNPRWVGLNRSKDASSRTAFTVPSNSTGKTTSVAGCASAEAGGNPNVIRWNFRQQDCRFSIAHWPINPSPNVNVGRTASCALCP